jgi:hypothetical protein
MWTLRHTTFNPYQIFLIGDYPQKWQHGFEDIPRVKCINVKRFPFTLSQIATQCQQGALAEEYRKHLIYFYMVEVIPEISDYVIILDSKLSVTSPLLLFDMTSKPVYTWMNYANPHYMTHMHNLLPSLKRILVTSSVAPWFILHKPMVMEIMSKVVEYHQQKSFWKCYIDATNKSLSIINASWHEVYLNYLAIYYPSSFTLKWVGQLKQTWDTVHLQPCIAMCAPQKCIKVITGPSIPSNHAYLTLLKQWRETLHQESVTWVDIGCGYFSSVYSHIPWNQQTDKYIGIDCDADKIVSNQIVMYPPSITFQCLDATIHKLPEGDICIIRDVCNYMCFIHILAMLHQVKKYKIVIITDVQPNQPSSMFNKDQPTRFDRRRATGLWLEQPPFNHVIHVGLIVPFQTHYVVRTVIIKN